MKRLFPAVCLYSLLIAGQSFAGSATWSSNPISSDWGDPANWSPNTVPNGPNDVATFATSSQTEVDIQDKIEVDSVVFQPSASAFTVREQVSDTTNSTLTFSGAGVVNSSGITQNFVLDEGIGGEPIVFLYFQNSASAGALTSFTIGGGEQLYFYDSSSAGSANFILDAQPLMGWASFYDHATAANATITANDGPSVAGAVVTFADGTSAGHATLIANGTDPTHVFGGQFSFSQRATAAQATVVVNGLPATQSASQPDFTGASCRFADNSSGPARLEIFGDGFLDVSFMHTAINIGSLEGDGMVYPGPTALSVGASGLTTAFSGPISNRGLHEGRGGSLSKVGIGTLTLSGSSDYAGGTTITEGFLRVDNSRGSGTGTGPIQVNGGTLGGGGIISGNVTVGTGSGLGAFIAPGSGNTTLTIKNALTFKADGTYSWRVQPGGKSDKLVANGVTIETGAQITGRGRGTFTAGTVLTAISNTSANAIGGTFGNLPDGGTIKIANNTFQANYEGGDGNDLTLTVVQ